MTTFTALPFSNLGKSRSYTTREKVALAVFCSVPVLIYGALLITYDLLVKGDEGFMPIILTFVG